MTSWKHNPIVLWSPIELLTKPDIPNDMRKHMEEMKGYQLHLVIQKQLQDIDITNQNQGCFYLPLNKLLYDFTTPKERELLNNDNINNANGTNRMEVKILDEGKTETTILLKKFIIGGQCSYCLMGRWNSFVNTNLLRSGNIIQLWSFRRERLIPSNRTFVSDLYFTLNKVDPRICL